MRLTTYLIPALASLAFGGCIYIAADETMSDEPEPGAAMRCLPAADTCGVGVQHALPPVPSRSSHEVTRVRLRNAITSRGLTLFDEIDHKVNAEAAGLELAPNTVFIFGNPKAGTALMTADPELGMALPLRAQVYEQDGMVYVRTSNIDRMAQRHGLAGMEGVTDKVRTVLADIAAEAAGGT